MPNLNHNVVDLQGNLLYRLLENRDTCIIHTLAVVLNDTLLFILENQDTLIIWTLLADPQGVHNTQVPL